MKTLESGEGMSFRSFLGGGAAGGFLAGALMAYVETLVILLITGPFLVDFPFLAKAIVVYGLAGAAGGVLVSLALSPFISLRRRLFRPPVWILFFAGLTVIGFVLEAVFYQLDIDTFRTINGKWRASAFLFIAGALVLGLVAGGLIRRIGRRLNSKSRTVRLASGAVGLIGLIAVFLAVRAVPAAAGSAARVIPPENGETGPMNVIIILIDALRADHLSAYGYPLPTSPRIDRLAAEGVLVRNCYAASNYSVPTHTSLFSGLYPSSHGNYSHYSTLDTALPTLPTILAAHGYRTASLYDNRLLGSASGLSLIFQTALGVNNEQKVSLALSRLRDRLERNYSMSRNILDVASSWIRYRPAREKPYFLFLNLMDAHAPYRPKEPFAREFMESLPDGGRPHPLAARLTRGRSIKKRVAEDTYPRLTPSDWRWLERIYDSNIRYLDEQIGLFLDRLEADGRLSRTLVIVTADHGEFFGEHGLGQHHQSALYDAGLRVPLILWAPERLAPAEILPPVSQVDILATVLSLAGYSRSIPKDTQSRDIRSVGTDHEVLAEFWDDNLNLFSRALMSGKDKLVVDLSGKSEVYDLESDPDETNDLSLARPGLLGELQSRLAAKLGSMPQRKSPADEKKKKELERLLRSLGYIK